MMLNRSVLLAGAWLVLVVGLGACGGHTSVSKNEFVAASPGRCYLDSCCAQPNSLQFTPHRLRCEALGAEKTGLWLDANQRLAEAIRQARVAEDRRAGAEVLCLALTDAARVADSRGDAGREIALYEEAERECASTYGANSEELARVQVGLANVYIDEGRLALAGAGLQNLLAVSHQQNNKGLRAAVLDALGRLEDKREDHSKARAFLKQALELRQQVFGERSVEAAFTMIHLGDNAMLLRGWVDARGWYMRALDAIELGIGKRNRHYVNAKAALASAFLRDRRYDALPTLYEELLVLSRDVFGSQSEEYAGTLNDSGALQYMQRQYGPAFEKFRQAAEIRRQTMPGSLLLGWTDLNAAKTRLEFSHCGLVRAMLLEAQDILSKQRQLTPPDPELPDYSAEFGRVAQLCAARPEPVVAAPGKSTSKPKKKH